MLDKTLNTLLIYTIKMIADHPKSPEKSNYRTKKTKQQKNVFAKHYRS